MKTEKEIRNKIEELREIQMKNIEMRNWESVVENGEQIEILKWALK